MQYGPAAPCAPMLCVVQCLCKGPQALFLLILKLFTQPDDSVDDVDGGISVVDDDICLSVCKGSFQKRFSGFCPLRGLREF